MAQATTADTHAALPPVTDLIVVKDHPAYGRSAYATQALKAGQLIINETPLLCIDSKDNKVLVGMLKQVQQYVNAHPDIGHAASMIYPEDWGTACGFWLAFCRASESVQQQVLQDMYNDPQGEGLDDTAPVRRTAVQAKVLAGMSPEVTKVLKIYAAVAAAGGAAAEVQPASSDPALIQKVLLATELNVHHMGAA